MRTAAEHADEYAGHRGQFHATIATASLAYAIETLEEAAKRACSSCANGFELKRMSDGVWRHRDRAFDGNICVCEAVGIHDFIAELEKGGETEKQDGT